MFYRIASSKDLRMNAFVVTENHKLADISNACNMHKEIAAMISGDSSIQLKLGEVPDIDVVAHIYFNNKEACITSANVLMIIDGYKSTWNYLNTNDLEEYKEKDLDYYKYHFGMENESMEDLIRFTKWVRTIASMTWKIKRNKIRRVESWIHGSMYTRVQAPNWTNLTF